MKAYSLPHGSLSPPAVVGPGARAFRDHVPEIRQLGVAVFGDQPSDPEPAGAALPADEVQDRSGVLSERVGAVAGIAALYP